MSLESNLSRLTKKEIKRFGVHGTLGDTEVNYVVSKIEANEIADGDIKWTDRKIMLDGSYAVDTDQLFTDFDGVVYTIIKTSPVLLKNTRLMTTIYLRKYTDSTTLTVTLYSWVDVSSGDGFVDTTLVSQGTVTAAQATPDEYDAKFISPAELTKANAVFILDASLIDDIARAFILYNNILYRELGRNGNRLIMEATDRSSYGI